MKPTAAAQADMKKVLQKALALSARADDRFLDLAKILAMLQHEAPKLWKEFLRKCGMDRRKGYYLANLGRQFAPLKLPKRRLERIGWTKLQIIGRHINEENTDELLKLAEESTAVQLEALMQGRRLTRKMRCVKMYLTPDQYRLFEEAVLRNGGTRSGRGLRGKKEALTRLIKRARNGAEPTASR